MDKVSRLTSSDRNGWKTIKMPKYKKGGYGRHSHTYETQTLMSFVKRVENSEIHKRISNLAGYQLTEQLFFRLISSHLSFAPPTQNPDSLLDIFYSIVWEKFCVVIQAFCRNTHITSARHFGHPFFRHHSPFFSINTHHAGQERGKSGGVSESWSSRLQHIACWCHALSRSLTRHPIGNLAFPRPGGQANSFSCVPASGETSSSRGRSDESLKDLRKLKIWAIHTCTLLTLNLVHDCFLTAWHNWLC